MADHAAALRAALAAHVGTAEDPARWEHTRHRLADACRDHLPALLEEREALSARVELLEATLREVCSTIIDRDNNDDDPAVGALADAVLSRIIRRIGFDRSIVAPEVPRG